LPHTYCCTSSRVHAAREQTRTHSCAPQHTQNLSGRIVTTTTTTTTTNNTPTPTTIIIIIIITHTPTPTPTPTHPHTHPHPHTHTPTHPHTHTHYLNFIKLLHHISELPGGPRIRPAMSELSRPVSDRPAISRSFCPANTFPAHMYAHV